MNRSDLIADLAAKFDQLTQQYAESAVRTIVDSLTDALARGRRIEIRDFGSFTVNRQAARMGRNARSGEAVVIAEKHVTHFKPGKALKENVNKGRQDS